MEICPLCEIRVSDWAMAGHKTIFGKDKKIYHKACVRVYEEKYGQPHPQIGVSMLVKK